MSVLTTKDVAIAAKMGYGMSYLIEKFQIPAEEINENIKKIYGKDEKRAKDVTSKLWAQEKRAQKSSAKRGRKRKIDTTVETTEQQSIDKLNDELETKRIECSKLEKTYEDAKAEHIGHLRSIASIDEQIKKLIEETQKLYDEGLSKIEANNAAVEKMNAATAARQEKLLEIADLEEKIKSLEALNVYVGGELRFFVEPAIEFDETGVDAKKAELFGREECELLTVREITDLAKLLVFESQVTRKHETLYDNDRIREAYEKLTASA